MRKNKRSFNDMRTIQTDHVCAIGVPGKGGDAQQKYVCRNTSENFP